MLLLLLPVVARTATPLPTLVPAAAAAAAGRLCSRSMRHIIGTCRSPSSSSSSRWRCTLLLLHTATLAIAPATASVGPCCIPTLLLPAAHRATPTAAATAAPVTWWCGRMALTLLLLLLLHVGCITAAVAAI
jgi:hypothetical protein